MCTDQGHTVHINTCILPMGETGVLRKYMRPSCAVCGQLWWPNTPTELVLNYDPIILGVWCRHVRDTLLQEHKKNPS